MFSLIFSPNKRTRRHGRCQSLSALRARFVFITQTRRDAMRSALKNTRRKRTQYCSINSARTNHRCAGGAHGYRSKTYVRAQRDGVILTPRLFSSLRAVRFRRRNGHYRDRLNERCELALVYFGSVVAPDSE